MFIILKQILLGSLMCIAFWDGVLAALSKWKKEVQNVRTVYPLFITSLYFLGK